MAGVTVDNFTEQTIGRGTDNKKVFGGSMETGTGQSLKTITKSIRIQNISAGSTHFLIPGVAGTITKIDSVLGGAITTADAVLTSDIEGVEITNGAITVAFTGSAGGTKDTAAPTALNVITATDQVSVATDGASSTTQEVTVTYTIELS